MDMKRVHSLLGDIERTMYYGDIQVGMGPMEKGQAGLAKLLVPEYEGRGCMAFNSLRDAYIFFTGDADISGFIKPDRVSKDLRSCQDFNSGTFSYALENALNVSLSKEYKSFPYHEEILISEKKAVTDFRAIDSVQLGYFGELPDVDPEVADYPDMPAYVDTESQYRLSQKGAVIWVTRRHVIDDRIELIQAMTRRMARAARLAHARYVWNFFINNSNSPDGTAWFTAGHGNLGNNALDITPLVTAITALANMTEPGSGEKIGLDLPSFNWWMVVPVALWDTAVKKNQCDSSFTANDLTTKVPNPCNKLFGEKNERIVTCPFLVDVNDWGVIRDKEDVPIVEMSYMNGHEEPELITETSPKPLSQEAFVRDRLGFKARHEYGGTLADYRGGYKSVVA